MHYHMAGKSYLQSTSTFENFRKEHKDDWHFDPSIKSQDFTYLGKLKTDFEPLLNLMKDDKNFKVFHIAEKNKEHQELDERINEFRRWGYTENNTISLQMTDKDFPEILKPFKEFGGFDKCNIVALKQYPGQFLPWHIDTLVGIRKEYNIPENVEVVRYTLMLEDWKWGHYFLVGNSIFHQWEQGDIIQFPPNMHHVTCNAGLGPKLTMTVTGTVSDESLKRKELGKFEYP